MSDEKSKEKTVFRAAGLLGGAAGGNPCAVDVKDGRIVRVRPLHYDWKYTKEEINPWKIQRDGKTFEELKKEEELKNKKPCN